MALKQASPRCQWHSTAIPALAVLFSLAVIARSAAAAPVAGLSPHERPAGAPVKTEVAGLGGAGMRGIEGVAPASIERMRASQGEWYTPFSRPGMSGPYDLRGWHRTGEGKGGPAPGRH